MNDINEEELPDTSTGEGDSEVSAPETTVDAADTESSSAEQPAAKTPKSSREDLIKSLTGQNKVEEEDDSDDEEAEAEKPVAEKSEEGKDEEEGEEPEGSKHDTSDKRSKAKERFEVLTNHNREMKAKLQEAEPQVKYAKAILDYCNTAGISAQEHVLWLAVAAAAKKDPNSVDPYLAKLGIKAKPVVQTVKEVPQELEDKILELATNGDLTPEGMKTLFGITRTARAAAAKPVEQVPEVKPTQVAETAKVQPPDFQSPEKVAHDRAIAKAAVDIDLKDSELASKYPTDWPKLRGQITKAMEAYQGTHPSRWVGFFEAEVAKALAKLKQPAKAPQSLRPSTHSTASNKPAPNTRAGVLAELTGRAKSR